MKLLTLLAVCLLMAAPLRANPYSEMVQLEALPGWTMQDGSQMAAIRLRLAGGWKTYWRAPGDAGIPPGFDWSRSDNIATVTPHWPTPVVLWQSGMRSIGFERELVLPVQLRPMRAGEPMRLRGQMHVGICKDICVPITLDIDTVIPSGNTRTPAIVDALAARPVLAAQAGVSQVSCTLAPSQRGLSITASFTLPRAQTVEAVVFETADPRIWVGEEKLVRVGRRITATSELLHVTGGGFAVDRSGLRLTVLGSGRAIDIQGCPAP